MYLDEIGDLPLPIQIKLLAALENHEVTRVGAHQPSPVDVRLVAATSIDLAQAVAVGKFHERRELDPPARQGPRLQMRSHLRKVWPGCEPKYLRVELARGVFQRYSPRSL